MARLPLIRLALAVVALGTTLAACGGIGGGNGGKGSRALAVVELERLPVTGANAELQRVVVVGGNLRVQVSPQSDTPQWRVVRQLTLSAAQKRELTRDARSVRGWKSKPATTCPGQPKGANVGELILRVGRRETLCPPTTAGPLLAFLGAYLPGSPRL